MTPWDAPEFVWADDETDEVAERPPANVPGEAGLWVLVLGDMSLFGLFFIVFAKEARHDHALFSGGASELHASIGAANTLVLLLSSYLVVAALQNGRGGHTALLQKCLWGATACAGTFTALKAVEWTLELHAGHTPASSLFFTFYYVLCGVHLLHVLIGAGLLTVWRRSGRTGLFAECAAVYWHMVDLLWVVIFALVYLAHPA